MAHNSFTDETMALADVYAESLLAAAKKKNQQDEVVAALMDLRAYMAAHPDFEQFLVAASIDDDSRRESLEKVFRGKLNDLVLNTIQVLNNRSRSFLLPAVIRAVELRIEEERHQQEVTIETATPLTDDLRSKLKDAMSQRLGKEALLIERVNPGLIGGFVAHVGDQRLDASVIRAVNSIRTRLAGRVSQEIRRSDAAFALEQ